MPRIRRHRSFWDEAKNRIKDDRLTPIISSFVSHDIFFRGGAGAVEILHSKEFVAERWATDLKSPLSQADNRNLARVAHFCGVHENDPNAAKADYLDFLKYELLTLAANDSKLAPKVKDLKEDNAYRGIHFSEVAFQLGYPKFEQLQRNPLRLLAELPLSVYITTSFHDFLEAELFRVRPKSPKRPESEILYWNDSLNSIPSIFDEDQEPDYKPSVDRPLVYHLYGRDKYPESLVLTEDDFLDFLVRVTIINRADVKLKEDTRKLPSGVRRALSGRSLLLLGYGIYDLEFRVCFKALIENLGEGRDHPHSLEGLAVQVEPHQRKSKKEIQDYLEKYFKQSKFEVFWGDPQKCIDKLWKLWKSQ